MFLPLHQVFLLLLSFLQRTVWPLSVRSDSILLSLYADSEKVTPPASYMWRIWYLKNRIRDILTEEDGVGVVEVILILVVLIGLVIIFKSQLTSLVQNIFKKITSESSGI